MGRQAAFTRFQALQNKWDVSSRLLRRAWNSWHLKLQIANLVSGAFPNYASGLVRSRLYRLAGFDIAPGVMIIGNLALPSAEPDFYDKLQIARGTVIGHGVEINIDAKVRLGTNVSLGPHVLIYTGSHQIGPGSNRRMRKVIAKPVTIEDGVWVGLGAMILPGVTVGHGSVVAAGAVVTQDVAPDSYIEGNPAQVVRQLPWGNR